MGSRLARLLCRVLRAFSSFFSYKTVHGQKLMPSTTHPRLGASDGYPDRKRDSSMTVYPNQREPSATTFNMSPFATSLAFQTEFLTDFERTLEAYVEFDRSPEQIGTAGVFAQPYTSDVLITGKETHSCSVRRANTLVLRACA